MPFAKHSLTFARFRPMVEVLCGSPELCAHDEWFFKVGFSADQGSRIPPFFGMHFESPGSELCVEELVVVVQAAQIARNSDEVAVARAGAQRLCALPQLPNRERTDELAVLFFERAVDRRVLNAEELCHRLSGGVSDATGTRRLLINASRWTEQNDACDDLSGVWRADVVVTVYGSQNSLLFFLRPGRVILMIYPRCMCAFFSSSNISHFDSGSSGFLAP